MSQHKKAILGLIFLACVALAPCSANVWDNVFGNIDAPRITFPRDFSVKFLLSNFDDSPSGDVEQTMKIEYAASQRRFRATLGARPPQGIEYTQLVVLKHNSSASELYAYAPLSFQCYLVRGPSSDAMGGGAQQLSISMDLSTAWRFIALYRGRTAINGTQYYDFDVSTLASVVDAKKNVQVHMYFDEGRNLKFVKILFRNEGAVLWLEAIESVTEQRYALDAFDVPQAWQCPREDAPPGNNVIDYSEYTLQDIIERV